MNKMKWTAGLLLVSIGTSLVTGCAAQQVKDQTIIEQSTVGPKVVIDQLGREVTIPQEVNRIVSSYYITSSLLIALEAEEKVVGLEIKADTREIYKRAAPHFLQLEAVGSGKTLNLESILALAPDLVIIPYRLESFIPQLEALDIPTIVVEPETMEGFIECVSLVGEAIGHQAQAQELLDYYEEQMHTVELLTSKAAERPLVYLSGSGTPLTTATGKMYQDTLINLAGGKNVSEALQEGYWAQVSPEQLLAWNPERWYVVSYADYAIDEILDDGKYQTIDAVKNDQVKIFPSSIEPWDYPTPSSVLGVLWLTQELHPELYSVDAYTQDATAFYKQFYDIEVSPEDMGL